MLQPTPLIQAHSAERAAEKRFRKGQLSRAAEQFEKAIASYEEAICNCTGKSNKEVIEALKVQQENCQHRVDSLRNRIQILRRVHARTNNLVTKMADDKENTIKKNIHDAMMQVDTLLECLSLDSPIGGDQQSQQQNYISKPKKDEKTIIEELHLCNRELKNMINALLNDVEDKQREIDALKDRIAYLEGNMCINCVKNERFETGNSAVTDLVPLAMP